MHLFAEPEVWILLAVVVFAIGVWKPARRAILGGLDARTVRIRDELEAARRLREEAQEALARYFPNHRNWDLGEARRTQARELQIVASGPRHLLA